MKVTSNNGSTGYSWMIDYEECKDVIKIVSGYVYYEPEEEDGFGVGYGEEIFTVTAKGKGECTFRIAYARAWEFVSFEDYKNQNGKIIEIPIRVPDDVDGSGDDECDPEDLDCAKEKKAFKIMGA